MQQLKYDGVKEVQTDIGTEIFLRKKVYNQDTGELDREIDIPFDPSAIPDRIAALQTEIDKLKSLQTKITENNFDTVEDKRTK
jgi:hypothetical protein